MPTHPPRDASTVAHPLNDGPHTGASPSSWRATDSLQPTAPAHRRTHQRPAQPPHRRAVVALLLLAVVTLTGCTSTGDDRPDAPPTPTRPTTTAPQEQSSGIGETERAIDALSPGGIQLTTRDLPAPPPGFTKADVRSFAQRALAIVRRGVAIELQGKNPNEAFNYVFANQYRQTTRLVRTETIKVAGDYDWQWVYASLFAEPPTQPAKFLALNWQVDSVTGALADGSTAPQLQLSLLTAVKHLVPAPPGADADLVPIVMKRTVTVVGFKPQGGPQWWPAIGIQATPLFGGKCAPVNGAILTPTQRPDILAKDMKELREFVQRPKKVTVTSSDTSSIDDFVRRYCDD